MPLLSKAEQHAKKAEDYPSIFGSINLTGIRENVGEILKLIGRDGIFREYTLHDANHVDAMLALRRRNGIVRVPLLRRCVLASIGVVGVWLLRRRRSTVCRQCWG
jgi:hypothetical protein